MIIVNVHGIGDDGGAELVGLAERAPAFDSAAGEQGGEGLGVVVAALRAG